MIELIKTLLVLAAYGVIAPLLGRWLSRNRVAERAALCLLVFMTSWFPAKLTLMLGSVEQYRGHTKGFEFSLLTVVGIALTVAGLLRGSARGQRWPPGTFAYLAYCVLSGLSFFAADNQSYVLMAAWKFTTAVMIFIGVFHAFRDETDLRWVLRTMAATLMLQALVCLKMRLFDGRFQIHGWFEHQNPMAMWSYMLGLPLLATAFAPGVDRREAWLLLGGVAGCALMVLLSVSRASLGAFGIGAVLVTVLAFLRGVTSRKVLIAGAGLCGALLAGLVAMDAMNSRLHEVASNEAEEDLRPVLNRQAKAMLNDSALGIGWNNFGLANSLPNERYASILMDWETSRGFRMIDENYFANPLTESLYWLLLSETGYGGFAGYIIFISMTLFWAARGVRLHWNTTVGYFLGGLLVTLLLAYAHGFVERILSQTKNLATWLILVGILARIDLARVRGPKHAPQNKTSAMPIPAIGAI